MNEKLMSKHGNQTGIYKGEIGFKSSYIKWLEKNNAMISKEEKKEILRLMEMCYDFGQDNIRDGHKTNLVELFDFFEDRLIKSKTKINDIN